MKNNDQIRFFLTKKNIKKLDFSPFSPHLPIKKQRPRKRKSSDAKCRIKIQQYSPKFSEETRTSNLTQKKMEIEKRKETWLWVWLQ